MPYGRDPSDPGLQVSPFLDLLDEVMQSAGMGERAVSRETLEVVRHEIAGKSVASLDSSWCRVLFDRCVGGPRRKQLDGGEPSAGGGDGASLQAPSTALPPRTTLYVGFAR